MDAPGGGLRHRLRDHLPWRKGRDGSKSPGREVPQTTSVDSMGGGESAIASDRLNLDAVSLSAPPIQVSSSPPVSILVPSQPSSVPKLSKLDKSSRVWRQAYERVKAEKPTLIQCYELILKDDGKVSQDGKLPDQLAKIATNQRLKAENRQWKFQWLDKHANVRDLIESILTTTNRAASLIAMGMTYAPPYVSIPWSAITALLPLMMNEYTQHKAAISGLDTVARILFSYRMAEDAFFDEDADIVESYTKSVLDLYAKVIEYQASAAQYFGKRTIERLGSNVLLGSTQWSQAPSEILGLDNDCRRSLSFLSLKSQAATNRTLVAHLEHQDQILRSFLDSVAAKKDEVARIVEWVSPIPYEQDHAEVRKKLGSGHFSSGRWFFQHPDFVSWEKWEDDYQGLWLCGGVGMGKSSLTSILVEKLMTDPDGVVAFFYSSRKVEKDAEILTARNSSGNILRSLLAQLCISADGSTVESSLQQRYERVQQRRLGGIGMSTEETIEILSDILSNDLTRFTLVIDALDEVTDYDELLDSLSTITLSKPNVRVHCSSRFEVHVQDHFEQARKVTIGSHNGNDISNFLDTEVPKRRSGSGMTDKQASRLKQVLRDRADGMFLWVKLELNIFLDEIKAKRIRLADDIETRLMVLESSEAVGEEMLTAAYDNVYDTAVGEGNQENRHKVVVKALRWVLCAFRALSLRELTYLAALKPDGTVRTGVQEGIILDLCSNLIIEDSLGFVRFAHLSVRHYLERKMPPDFSAAEAHKEAALACARSLLSPNLPSLELATVTLTRSFHLYVRYNWCQHFRRAPKSQHMNDLINQLTGFDVGGPKSTDRTATDDPSDTSSAIPLGDRLLQDSLSRPRIRSSTQEFYNLEFRRCIADEDYLSISRFIAKDIDLSTQDNFGNSYLHEAIRYMYIAVIRTLAVAGAPLNAKNAGGNTPMHIAAMWNFDQGARELLRFGSERNLSNNMGQAPLHIAIIFNSLDVAQTLISAGADLTATDHQSNTALHHAAMFRRNDVVMRLVLAGHRLDSVNDDDDTALTLALRRKLLDLSQLLVSLGAEVRQVDRDVASESHLSFLLEVPVPTPRREMMNRAMDATGPNYHISSPTICKTCDIKQWMSGSNYGTRHKHHVSLHALQDSAISGCELCHTFLTQFEQDSSFSRILDQEDSQILVWYDSGSDIVHPIGAMNSLTVSMANIEFQLELCIGNGM